jgi:phosphoenolpyruvate carboxykinase (ATP)
LDYFYTFVAQSNNKHNTMTEEKTLVTKTISLKKYGIDSPLVNYQLIPEDLHEITIDLKMGVETTSGALAVNTGTFTGRAPRDRFIVKDQITDDKVWWGEVNQPFLPEKFDALYDKMVTYLSDQEIYARDCYACADKNHQINIRVINQYSWCNLFVYNMFLRPTDDELENFQEDWLIVNAPGFEADAERDGTRQGNFTIINFTKKTILIGGTGYTGEIKKGIFSALNFILPVFKNTLPMHCSANVGKDGDTSIFFGLSGTGKTTLSADPARKLIGDDEHGWTLDNHIFNFEGGCYAKVINLSEEIEPDIFGAITKGALLENVLVDKNGEVDYTDTSITQNTRVSYPIDHIKNIQVPSIGSNPKNIFFLTADAFGVLPPISKLTPGQAAYHFISGYTAKIAGTEDGVTEPIPSFSACFGAPFMPLHPTVYAEMLSKKIKDANVNVWLVNTGWTGGPYGIGTRMKLKHTRAMIQEAMAGRLGDYSSDTYTIHPTFLIAYPKHCPNVPSEVLCPKNTWEDKDTYEIKAKELAKAFNKNFEKYKAYADHSIISGGPA